MFLRAARLGCLIAVLFAAGANGQSLKALRAQESEREALSREVAYTNSVCNSSMTASIDWRSLAGWPKDENLVAACDGALGAIEAMCRASGEVKARIGSLNNFICAGDGSGPSLGRASFRYGASPGVNGFSETKGYLDRAF